MRSRRRRTSCSRVGTRLQDFTTGSWTVFATRTCAYRAQRIALRRRQAPRLPLAGDAREGLRELAAALGGYRRRTRGASSGARGGGVPRASCAGRTAPGRMPPPVRAGRRRRQPAREPDDYVVASAGGFPGELNVNWLSRGVATFDCEYGFSCMGYELVGRLGRAHGAASAARCSRSSATART